MESPAYFFEGLAGLAGLDGAVVDPFTPSRPSLMAAMSGLPGQAVEETCLCPRTWLRSMGMLYLFARYAESLAEEFDAAGLFEEPLRFTQRFVTFRKKVRPKQVPFPLAAENDAQDALRALGA